VRYLIVVRHAKAEAPAAGLADFDRGLTKRGRDQCRQLREWASDPEALARYGPAIALVSAAARTKETFKRAFKGTGLVERHVYSELIYNGRRAVSGEDLLMELASLDPVTSSLMVVGHNPTVLELVVSLAAEVPESLLHGRYPLGGAYVFSLPDDRPVGLSSYEIVDSFVPDRDPS
jgi:phosphohistidine phosphatase